MICTCLHGHTRNLLCTSCMQTHIHTNGNTHTHAQLLQSQLKFLHSLLSPLNGLQSTNLLPTILASLKANMAFGLPGQSKTIASIHPPLSVPPSQHRSPKSKKLQQTVAGPQPRKKEYRNKSRDKERKGKSPRSSAGSGDGGRGSDQQSSDSELSDSSLRTTTHGGVSAIASRELVVYSSSDSDVSDMESTWSKLKVINSKVRHQAYSCLATIFKVCNTMCMSLYIYYSHLPKWRCCNALCLCVL